MQVVLAAVPQRHVGVAARGRDAHERLRHEAGDQIEFARNLPADLAVGGQPVGIAQNIVIHPVELELARRVLVVALDHVEAHLARIFHDLHEDRAQALELVDVVAERFREAPRRLAVLVLGQPHHLRLGAHAQLQAVMLGPELLMEPAQVAAAIRGQEGARVLALLTVAKQRAIYPRDALVPGQLHHGFRLGDTDQLGGLRPVAEILAATVHEQVHGGAIDELEALPGDALPVVRRDALAHDPAGDRDELQIEILDPQLVDLLADFRYLCRAPLGFEEGFKIRVTHMFLPWCTPLIFRNSYTPARLPFASRRRGHPWAVIFS